MESSGKGTKPKKEGVDPATLPPFEHWRQLISSILGRKRKPPLLSEQETIQLIVNSSHQSKQSSIEAVVKVLPPFMGEKHEVGFALHRVLEALVNSDEESFRILDMLFQSYIDRVTQGTHLQADQEWEPYQKKVVKALSFWEHTATNLGVTRIVDGVEYLRGSLGFPIPSWASLLAKKKQFREAKARERQYFLQATTSWVESEFNSVKPKVKEALQKLESLTALIVGNVDARTDALFAQKPQGSSEALSWHALLESTKDNPIGTDPDDDDWEEVSDSEDEHEGGLSSTAAGNAGGERALALEGTGGGDDDIDGAGMEEDVYGWQGALDIGALGSEPQRRALQAPENSSITRLFSSSTTRDPSPALSPVEPARLGGASAALSLSLFLTEEDLKGQEVVLEQLKEWNSVLQKKYLPKLKHLHTEIVEQLGGQHAQRAHIDRLLTQTGETQQSLEELGLLNRVGGTDDTRRLQPAPPSQDNEEPTKEAEVGDPKKEVKPQPVSAQVKRFLRRVKKRMKNESVLKPHGEPPRKMQIQQLSLSPPVSGVAHPRKRLKVVKRGTLKSLLGGKKKK